MADDQYFITKIRTPETTGCCPAALGIFSLPHRGSRPQKPKTLLQPLPLMLIFTKKDFPRKASDFPRYLRLRNKTTMSSPSTKAHREAVHTWGKGVSSPGVELPQNKLTQRETGLTRTYPKWLQSPPAPLNPVPKRSLIPVGSG